MRKRILAVAAMALAMLGTTATSVQTASATTQQAAAGPIYWSFSDGFTDDGILDRCLTEYSTGVIRMADCSGGTAQQWYWINSAWDSPARLLKNRWTGDCLVAPANYGEDIKSGSCDDWTSRHWAITSESIVDFYSYTSGYAVYSGSTDHVAFRTTPGLYWNKIQMN
ncbi:hypothetical protein ABZ479_26495 [Streptomyces sp. NPDC005722]